MLRLDSCFCLEDQTKASHKGFLSHVLLQDFCFRGPTQSLFPFPCSIWIGESLTTVPGTNKRHNDQAGRGCRPHLNLTSYIGSLGLRDPRLGLVEVKRMPNLECICVMLSTLRMSFYSRNPRLFLSSVLFKYILSCF